jgi:2-polyprenyl-6-methoxyphenol hydroxylase-like FAD-dependent oxidoreductase
VQIAIVGAGPIGLFSGLALARQGHDVLIVDRDPGPPAAGPWERRGVMQFELPHFFRPIVRQVLLAALPDVWDAIVTAGGRPGRPQGMPEEMTGLCCRRSTFERAIRTMAKTEPGITMMTGHADRIVVERGRITGLIIDGRLVEADLVLCAVGRSSRVDDGIRGPGEGGPCGFSYAARQYRARPGAEDPPAGYPMGALYAGYLVIMFPQDDRTLCALIVRASDDHGLVELRRTECFEAATRRIPHLAAWTDPNEFRPITAVRAGAGLTNTYRGQSGSDGRQLPAGLFFVGDAVSTTNPAAGRGVSLGLRQANTLVGMLSTKAADLRDVSGNFDVWCTKNIRPWFLDHVYWDATLLRRFAGYDIDVDARIPSDVICAAADADAAIRPAALSYMSMSALPSVLDAVEGRARAVLRTGWRPPVAAGLDRKELAEAILRRAA